MLDEMFPQLLQQYQECSDLMGLFGKHDSARVSLPKELSRDVQRFVSLVFIEIRKHDKMCDGFLPRNECQFMDDAVLGETTPATTG